MNFYSLLTSTINIRALEKSFQEANVFKKKKPWILKGLLISIEKKQKLHKTHYILGLTNERLYYKKYCNF